MSGEKGKTNLSDAVPCFFMYAVFSKAKSYSRFVMYEWVVSKLVFFLFGF